MMTTQIESPIKLIELTPPESDVVACFVVGPFTDPEVKGELTAGLTVAICAYKRPDSLMRELDSLRQQDRKPDHLVIVDASPDDRTEQMMRKYAPISELAETVRYYHVRGALDTLTCSRNFALRRVTTDVMVFFDDDVVFEPDCLREMEAVHREYGPNVVGVGAVAENHITHPQMIWQFRRWFGIVPNLLPGRYARSGIANTWSFLPRTDEVVEGDWLGGFAMMWKTSVALRVGFNEGFGGHSMGEDLDFGLRMAQYGKIYMNGRARLQHLVEPAGRPNSYMIAYTGMRNAHSIHKRCLRNRTWRDAAWFLYAYAMDTLLRSLVMLRPGKVGQRFNFILGRLRYFIEMPWTK
jgi:GT2 family glycosyltransferase